MQHEHSNSTLLFMATLQDISNQFLEILLPIKCLQYIFCTLLAGTLPFTNVSAGHHRHKVGGGGRNLSGNWNPGTAEISIVLAVAQYQA